jgi:hypothetical protein
VKPIEAIVFRDDYFKQLQEKEKEKQSPDLENVLTEKLIDLYLQDVEEEINLKKTLKWGNFKKIAKHKELFDMKKFVEKWLEREKKVI